MTLRILVTAVALATVLYLATKVAATLQEAGSALQGVA